MIPILYALDTTEFANLGKGKLTETQSCVVIEELNGAYEIEFDYPVTGVYFSELINGGLVVVNAPNNLQRVVSRRIAPAVFEIYKYSEPIDGVVTFYGQEYAHKLFSTQVVCGNGYGRGYNYSVVPSINYRMNSDDSESYGNGIPITAPKTRLACLLGNEESVVSTLGYDVVLKGNIFHATNNGELMISLAYLSRLGDDHGARIHYGYNLIDLNRTKDTSGTYNAVVPYWVNAGTFKYVTGYIVQPTTAITPIRAVTMDLTSVFEEEPTETEMIEYARNHLDNDTPWVGENTITVDFQSGASIEDGAQVSLGDIVTVHWEDGQIDTKMRAVAYKYDVITERYAEITLGSLSKQYVAVTGGGSAVSSQSKVYNDLYVTAVQTNTVASIAAASNSSFSATLSEEGFTPIGIVGYYIQGTGSSFCNVYRMQIQNPTTALVSVRNTRDQAATNIYVMLYVLWKRK